MTRNVFDRELDHLHQELTHMGQRVNQMIEDTITAMNEQDADLARAVSVADDEVDAMEHRIEQACMRLIARQQPIARDLRTIGATLKIITDMERVADQCCDICEIILRLVGGPYVKPLVHLPLMFEKARTMFTQALDTFIRRDVDLARQVCKNDDEVDTYFTSIILELSGIMSNHPTQVPEAVDLMFITKYVERIGDHATNIAEWAIFMETGEHPDLN
nr:phosphate signaling complex protein PhoU [Maliibacterium massiliense]